jgi:hypothetical protein
MRTWHKVILMLGCSACVGAGLGAARAFASRQPHMQAALDALQTAQSELQNAEDDKGGWRVQALQSVGSAITDVQNGIAVGKEK